MKIRKYLLALASALFFFSSCVSDLDVMPLSKNEVTEFDAHAELAKIYAGYAVTGNKGPAGEPDIAALDDEGMSGLIRLLWNVNELTGDDAICAWNDEVVSFNYQNYSSSSMFVLGFYSRLYYELTLCNHFIGETKGKSQYAVENAEARFMRALTYFYVIDVFGGGPFVDENSGVGSYYPNYINRTDLFNYVESELRAIETENQMKAPKANEYGRADMAAVWSLLSRLYLNAEVYTGKERFADAALYAKKVIDAPYSLEPVYKHLFGADNHTSPEFIFAVNYDGTHTVTYGGTTFLIMSCLGEGINFANYGVSGGWGGNRARKALVDKFKENDDRALFFTTGRTLEINNPTLYTEGYSVVKFSNVTRLGKPGSNLNFPDTDFALFRLGEIILNYAEAICKTSGGDKALAVTEINKLRRRANAPLIAISDLSDVNGFFIPERSRELYFEGQRRTDLIRFGMYDKGIWDWKGGVKEGRQTASYLKLFPLPASDIIANPNLKGKQNPGY